MKIIVNIVGAILVLLFGVVGLIVFGQKPEVPTEEQNADADLVAVVTAEVLPYNGPFNLEIDGEAVTYRVVTVGAEVEGRIVKKPDIARGGTYVRKGDLLFEIDPTNYQLEINRLQAQLQQADEEQQAVAVDLQNTADLIALAEEEWTLQQKHLTRMKQLQVRRTANETEVETAMKQELASRNSLQMLRNQQNALTQQHKTQQAGKALVETQLRRAESDLNRCVVRSPLEGRIVSDEVEEGDYIKPGEVLVHISDGSRMEVKCQLRAEELAWVWAQKVTPAAEAPQGLEAPLDPLNVPPVPCEVAFRFEGVETIWDGYIGRLEGTGIDRDTRTFPCRVLVPEPQRTRFNNSAGGRATISPPVLLSGMYVAVRIPITSPIPLLQLPLEAVRPGGQIWTNRDGELHVLEVSPAHVEGKTALVRQSDSGLHPTDRVIISPLASVQEGMKIQESVPEATE